MKWKDGSVSVATAAALLGVPCSAVWHQIIDGRLNAYTERRGNRVYTRVLLTAAPSTDAAAATVDGTPLTTQVERLTATIERLTAMLRGAGCDSGAHTADAAIRRRGTKRRRDHAQPAPSGPDVDDAYDSGLVPADPAAIPPLESFLKPSGGPPQALRPNPMTHPVDVLPRPRPDSRDDLLEPVRQLFEHQQRQWWHRLPLVSRG